MRVEELVDLSHLRTDGRPPTPKEIREALPRGWVLEPDGVTARRDARLLFREGWILVLGLACFGAIVAGLFWSTFPRGWAGIARLAVLVAVLVVLGGVVAPRITKALNRR